MRALLRVSTTALALLVCASERTQALNNGLGKTPQMGYNSWYDLTCSPSMNESTLRATADAMNRTGLLRAGYSYLNLDDCFVSHRLPNGTLVPDAKTFPSGMRALSDYVHDRGMMFGVYTDRGDLTCAGRPAAQGFEKVDAETYANNWQVDYLKEDSCNVLLKKDHAHAFAQYGAMRDALNATGRAIFFSLCGWNTWYAPQGASLGNSWRIGPDDSNWGGVLQNIDDMNGLEQYAGPDKGWNDPCLLLSQDAQGKFAVTELQSRAQFSMWAVLAAPLLISGSVLRMSDFTLATYTNKRVIAVSQDALGAQGRRVAGGDLSQCHPAAGNQHASANCSNVWARPLSGQRNLQRSAMVFLNVDPHQPLDVVCDEACWRAAGFSAADFPLEATDLWTGEALQEIASIDAGFVARRLPKAGGVLMLEVMAVPKAASLPHLDIPKCSEGNATVDGFMLDGGSIARAGAGSTAPTQPFEPATQHTSVRVCHDEVGMHFSSVAQDSAIFNSASKCNDPVFSDGDVLEVFISPVEHLEDAPSWYLEIDTAASGALWGMIAHNPRNMRAPNIGGNATGGASCAVADEMGLCGGAGCVPEGSLEACLMRCSGAATFVNGLGVSVSRGKGWWGSALSIPWSVFPTPLVNATPPAAHAAVGRWPLWRLNLYRYDFPQQGDRKSFELSAWSPSGMGDFHLPQFFGSAVLK